METSEIKINDVKIAAAPKPKMRMWILYYRYGIAPNLWKAFELPAALTLQDALVRAKQHCLTMGYKFNFVQPFLQDLDEQEMRKKAGIVIEETEVFKGL